MIAGGTVLVTSQGLGDTYGFDAAGVRNCTGSPKTCTPTLRFKLAALSPAVRGTTLFTLRGRQIAAYDGTGSTHCSGTSLRTCTPLWKSTVHAGSATPLGRATGSRTWPSRTTSCTRATPMRAAAAATSPRTTPPGPGTA